MGFLFIAILAIYATMLAQAQFMETLLKLMLKKGSDDRYRRRLEVGTVSGPSHSFDQRVSCRLPEYRLQYLSTTIRVKVHSVQRTLTKCRDVLNFAVQALCQSSPIKALLIFILTFTCSVNLLFRY